MLTEYCLDVLMTLLKKLRRKHLLARKKAEYGYNWMSTSKHQPHCSKLPSIYRSVARAHLLSCYTTGVLIGLIIGTVLLQTPLLGWIRDHSNIFSASSWKLPEINLFNARYTKSLLWATEHDRRPVYIGVLSSWKFVRTRATVVARTWGRELPKENMVEYFVGDLSSAQNATDLSFPVVTFKGVSDTQYPPQQKAFRMLQHMCDEHLSNFDWFFRADDDVYIKIEPFLALLRELNPEHLVYLGQKGHGKAEDIKRLQLQAHKSYCLGGPGVLFSRAALQRLCPHLKSCEKNAPTVEEDVEIGRCMHIHLNMECTTTSELNKAFYHPYKDLARNKIPYSDNIEHDKDISQAITLHHAKSPATMYNLHLQYLREQLNGHTQNVRYWANMIPKIQNDVHQK